MRASRGHHLCLGETRELRRGNIKRGVTVEAEIVVGFVLPGVVTQTQINFFRLRLRLDEPLAFVGLLGKRSSIQKKGYARDRDYGANRESKSVCAPQSCNSRDCSI